MNLVLLPLARWLWHPARRQQPQQQVVLHFKSILRTNSWFIEQVW